MAGAMSTLPPLAPIFASVTAASPAVALRLTLRAPVRLIPLSSVAVVVSVIRLRATDAPTPTLVVVTPPAVGSAFTVLAALLAAVIVASPPVRTTAPASSAVVVWLITARPERAGDRDLAAARTAGRLGAVGGDGVGPVDRLGRRHGQGLRVDGVACREKRLVGDVREGDRDSRADGRGRALRGRAIRRRRRIRVRTRGEGDQATRGEGDSGPLDRGSGARGREVERYRRRDVDLAVGSRGARRRGRTGGLAAVRGTRRIRVGPLRLHLLVDTATGTAATTGAGAVRAVLGSTGCGWRWPSRPRPTDPTPSA